MDADPHALVLPGRMLERLQSDIKVFFESQRLYATLGAPWKRRLLLMGPSGSGKTATIKAIIQDCIRSVAVIYARHLRDDMCSDVGGIVDLFKRARSEAPCLLILEDIDSVTQLKARTVLFKELDSLQTRNGVLILVSTNYPAYPGDALLNRPSRFDQKIVLDLPTLRTRERVILKFLEERVGVERLHYDTQHSRHQWARDIKDVDSLALKLAEHTEVWSFALLEELFTSYLCQLVSCTVAAAAIPGWFRDRTRAGSDHPQIDFPPVKASVSILIDQLNEVSAQFKPISNKESVAVVLRKFDVRPQPYLQNLPVELLLRIFKDLNHATLRALRVCCKAFATVVASVKFDGLFLRRVRCARSLNLRR
ncbi:hypothetical protein V8E36_000162 [Tilletia maclaganii]